MHDPEALYQRLAARLDELPNSFPPADDGSDLRLLERLIMREEDIVPPPVTEEVWRAQRVAQRMSIS